jgi:hypothetical protein
LSLIGTGLGFNKIHVERGNRAPKHNLLKGRDLVSAAMPGFSADAEIPGRTTVKILLDKMT